MSNNQSKIGEKYQMGENHIGPNPDDEIVIAVNESLFQNKMEPGNKIERKQTNQQINASLNQQHNINKYKHKTTDMTR